MATKLPAPSADKCGTDGELRRVFARFDANGDGKISAPELRAVLVALDSPPPAGEVERMMAEMDKDGDGYVDVEEFCEFLRQGGGGGFGASAAAADEGSLREAFKLYDADGNGKISAGELHKVLRGLGEKCSMDDCRRMIRSVDADGDGYVNFAEFKKMMNGGTK